MFTAGQLSCPRCGASFRPTVSWGYFRLLLFIVVALALIVIVFLSKTNLWIFLFLIAVTIFFWFLPRFIDLEHIPRELRLPEGAIDAEQLKLSLENEGWEEKREAFEEQSRFRQLIYILIAMALLLLLVASLKRGF